MEKAKSVRKKLRHQRPVGQAQAGTVVRRRRSSACSFVIVIALGTLSAQLCPLPAGTGGWMCSTPCSPPPAPPASPVWWCGIHGRSSHGSGRWWCCCSFRWAAWALVTLTSFFALAMRRRMGFRDLRLLGESVSADGYAQAKERAEDRGGTGWRCLKALALCCCCSPLCRSSGWKASG